MQQDPREFFGEEDPREIQKLLAEVMEDDSIPYNSEGSDQDPDNYDKKEDAHLSWLKFYSHQLFSLAFL